MEAELAHHARTLDAGQLAVLGKRILAYLDHDGPRPKDPVETRRWLRFGDRDGGVELAGWLDREAAEIVRAALSPLAAPRPTTDTEVDLRNASQRDADALVELAARALTEGELPTEGGQRPQVVVTVSLPVLQGRIGMGSLALGGPINADIARRIACDAEIIPVVLGSRGEPLDVGRASRTVPTAIRRAVIVRDGGCAFPGCSVPARWCDIHHVVALGRSRPYQRRKLCGFVRPPPQARPPFRLANRHDQRHPRIPPTSVAGRPTTPQPTAPRPRPDPKPPIMAEPSAAHQRKGHTVSSDSQWSDAASDILVGGTAPLRDAGIRAPPVLLIMGGGAQMINWQVRSFRVVRSPGFEFDEASVTERADDRGHDHLGMVRQSIAALASGYRVRDSRVSAVTARAARQMTQARARPAAEGFVRHARPGPNTDTESVPGQLRRRQTHDIDPQLPTRPGSCTTSSPPTGLRPARHGRGPARQRQGMSSWPVVWYRQSVRDST